MLAYVATLSTLLPSRALAVDAGTGDGALLDVLAPAFERPLITKPSRSMSTTAVEAMDQYIALLERSYERYRGRQRTCVNLTDYAFQSGETVDSLGAALDRVLA